MNVQQLLDFLARENIGLEVWDDPDEGCRLYSFQDQDWRRFEWYHGSLTVNVWTRGDGYIDCFTVTGISCEAELSEVLFGIKEYRKER